MIAVVGWIAGEIVAFQALSPERLKFSESKKQVRQNIFPFGIISLAMIESVAIYGLALVFVGFEKNIFFPFDIAAAAGMLLYLNPALSACSFHDALPEDSTENG